MRTPEASDKLASTAGYYAAFIGLGIAVSVTGPTLPGLARNTHSQLDALGFLFTARAVGYILGSLLPGRLYDRLPGHLVAAAALLIMASLLALIPVCPLLVLLVVAIFLLGAADSVLDVGANTLLVRQHGDKSGPFMTGLHFFFGVGAFVAPIAVGWAISAANSITWAYWGLALLLLPPAFWLMRQPSPAAHMETTKASEGQADLALMVLIALLFFGYVGAEVGFAGWISSYAVASRLTGEAEAAYLASAFWGVFTVGRLAAVPISSRVRPRYVLLADILGTLVFLGLICLLPHSRLALWAGTVGTGLCLASFFPTNVNLASRRITMTGRITGIFFSVGSLGSMTLPLAVGQIFVRISPRAGMFAFWVDALLMLAVWAALMLRTQKSSRLSPA
jgi:FHS family Na+ dependent glucose MFS transporter 1